MHLCTCVIILSSLENEGQRRERCAHIKILLTNSSETPVPMCFGTTPWKLARRSLWCQRCAFFCFCEKMNSQIWPSYKRLKNVISVFMYLAESWQNLHSSERFVCTKPTSPVAPSRCCLDQPCSSPLAWPRFVSIPMEVSTTLQPPLPFLDAAGCWEDAAHLPHAAK